MGSSGSVKKQTKFSQTMLPRVTLKEALTIAESLRDNFAASSTTPINLAKALDRSPGSSDWRYLTGAAVAYGLTSGGYNSDQIELTPLGKSIVMPTEEGQREKSLTNSALTPQILKEFYQKYNGNKFPRDDIAKNVLMSLGVPQDRPEEALSIIRDNGKFVGILIDIKDGVYVQISGSQLSTSEKSMKEDDLGVATETGVISAEVSDGQEDAQDNPLSIPPAIVNNKVFISHGKNGTIVNQLKEILKFGKLEPVVAEERETTSIPVPEKVFTEMRNCYAGIIHVAGEEKVLDANGKEMVTLNQNVLIEIGAAIALYGKNIILLVQKETILPSNLQGLYRCDYEGDRLDYEATMKLLKTFNEFK